MAKNIQNKARFVGGISDFLKEGTTDSYYMGRNIDHRTDPRSIKLNPKAIKESGTVIEDLIKWSDIFGTDLYAYGDTGKIYKRTSAGSWSKLRQAPDSHGNGMNYFGEDNFLYYTTDKLIGRYGPLTTNPQFNDDYFGSLGGVPLNTNALYLVSASSQYAYSADTATLSISGDLSLEAQIHPLSLPATGETQTIVSKWNGSGNLRSYKFDITTQSNYFGDGSDGALTIAANTTEAPIDSACTGTSGSASLTATNASFAAGQMVLIHQTQGATAGTWMKNKILSYTAGTITLDSVLNVTYTTGAQVRVLKQYTTVTINSGKTYTAKAWNGTVGGILAFFANTSTTITGSISANGSNGNSTLGKNISVAGATGGGFRGGIGYNSDTPTTGNGQQGEGTSGAGTRLVTANGNGGGGGGTNFAGASGGGGGGNGTAGGQGTGNDHPTNGYGGAITGSADLTTMSLGGGGGGVSFYSTINQTVGSGASGGGIIFIASTGITVTGSILANGGNGGANSDSGSGGSGAGGSILLKSQVAVLGAGLISAVGGTSLGTVNPLGGAGGTGRIHLDYYTSYTGTTNPTLNVVQDNNLGAADGYVLRLQLSSNGTAVTTFSKSFVPIVDLWQQVAVSFDSARTADATKCYVEFFYNGVTLGTIESATQTISDNTSQFFVGAYKNDAGTATGFYNGYIDEVRVWSKNATASDYLQGMSQHILTTLPYLNAYYKFNSDLTDATANANDLTGSGTPTYVSDVPFPSPTTRLDIDQMATTTGNAYTMITSINEGAAHRKTFTPEKDPQKSIAVLVASVGTGDWTLTVHDQYNNEIASKTIANASLAVGYNEFVFSTPWRPLFLNADYHFHLTSTVADGTVTCTTASNLTTVSFRTYFQFLVTDTEWHPVAKMLQFLVFGNERYIGTYEVTLYNPNAITLPAGYRVRCFGYYKEYLAIGTQRGDSITQQDSGRIYFWDGIASTYNYYIDVPEGGINALLGSKGKLEVWAGYSGDYLVYSGGDSAEQIKRIPKIEDDKYLEVYPGAVCKWRMLTRWGINASDSSSIEKGIYTWGAQNVRYPDSLSQDFIISTGNYGSSVKIGMLKVIDKKLLIGWQDNISYGVDYIDYINDPVFSGTIEMILDDYGAVWKEKEALTLVATFKPLISGQSVDIKYQLDRSGLWTSLGAVNTAGKTFASLIISSGGSRFREIQYAADLTTSTTTSPTLLSLTLEADMLTGEERITNT